MLETVNRPLFERGFYLGLQMVLFLMNMTADRMYVYSANWKLRKLTLGSKQGHRASPHFRLFSTTNTIGLGDTTGLYHGTQQINQGQMDRWSIVSTLTIWIMMPSARSWQAKLRNMPPMMKERG